MGTEQVKLGDRTYEIVPQKIGRIRRKLTAVWQLFADQSEGVQVTEIGPQLHEALEVFIPDLDPYWKLAGYASEAELEAGDEADLATYDSAADHSPTIPEIGNTIEMVLQVNDGERIKRVFFGLVDPASLRSYIDAQIKVQRTKLLEREGQRLGSEPSRPLPSSPPTNGASGPTSSGTTPPIPASAGSPPAD